MMDHYGEVVQSFRAKCVRCGALAALCYPTAGEMILETGKKGWLFTTQPSGAYCPDCKATTRRPEAMMRKPPFFVRLHWSAKDERGPYQVAERPGDGSENILATVKSKDDADALAKRLNELWRLANSGAAADEPESKPPPPAAK